jgi:autophagy-related protein 18
MLARLQISPTHKRNGVLETIIFIFLRWSLHFSSLSIGTTKGYTLYQLNDELESVHRHDQGEVYIAERLFSSSLVAVVWRSDPRTLKVCHFNKGTEITSRKFDAKILAVKLNREVLVVCLEESLYIHNIRDMSCLHVINETPPNRLGLCALSIASNQRSYLAYPGHSTVGELQIFDATNLSSKAMIPAHTSQLMAISFSPDGSRVATSSEKGTVIRVFAVHDGGSKLYELRRGLKRTVNIYSLSFSPCSRFLASSSNTETVHVFRLDETSSSRGSVDQGQAISQSPPHVSSPTLASSPPADGGWLGYINTVVTASASYLPSQVTDTLLQGRAFATVHHNQPGMKNVCALAMIKRKLILVIASEDGYVYYYDLNLDEGGDCSLIRQFHVTAAIPKKKRGSHGEEADDEDDEDYETAAKETSEGSQQRLNSAMVHRLIS